MPNYCDNTFKVQGDTKDVVNFFKNSIGAELQTVPYNNNVEIEHYLDFEKIRPMPKSEEENWYEWRLQNWGTKWLPCDTYYFNIKKNDNITTLKIGFTTAWCPPDKLYKYLMEKYKDTSLKFEANYYEGGCAFAGEAQFAKGEIENEYYIEYIDDDEENNISYYKYIIEKGHESTEWMADYMQERMEEEGIDEDTIEDTIKQFENCYKVGNLSEVAKLYLEATK